MMMMHSVGLSIVDGNEVKVSEVLSPQSSFGTFIHHFFVLIVLKYELPFAHCKFSDSLPSV